MEFDSGLELFLIVPEGYPEYTAIVIAKDKESALSKSLNIEGIGMCSAMDCEINVKNVTKMFLEQGFSIFVAREGVYH